MRSKNKSIAFVLAACVMALASVPASARVGAPAPAPAKPAPAPAPKPAPAPAFAPAKSATPARAGGGSDSGMKRNNVMAEARQQQAAVPAPARPAPGYGNTAGNGYAAAAAPTQAPAQQPKQGYPGRQVAGAVAAGAVGGYLLNEATRPAAPTHQQQGYAQPGYAPNYQPGYQPGYAPAQAPAPMAYDQPRYPQPAPVQAAPAPQVVQYMPAPQQSSGIGAFGWLLILGVLGAIGYVLYRKFSEAQSIGVRNTGYAPSGTSRTARPATPTPAASAVASDAVEQALLDGASKLFCDVQEANNRGDKAALTRLVDASYVSALTEGIDARSEPSDTQVLSLQIVGNRVLGFEREANQYVGSVQFQAMISEGGAPAEPVQEVWHFVRPLDGGSWKLAGIEQV